MRHPVVPAVAAGALCLLALCVRATGSSPVRAGDAADDPVFFREPDKQTAARIRKLIAQCTVDAVATRREARDELEQFGYWSVDPLLTTLAEREDDVRCAASIVLAAIGDRRALQPLRDSVAGETDELLTSAFSVLALGRFRDALTVPVLESGGGAQRGSVTMRAASALALARIRGEPAKKLLVETLRTQDEHEPVNSARILAMGFFPEVALVLGTARPSPALESILSGTRVQERRTAVLAFLVATARRKDGKETLLGLLSEEGERVVQQAVLLGLSAFPDEDVTIAIAKSADSRAPDAVRELACDLLVNRTDPAARPTLLKLVRGSGSNRLRAAATLALGTVGGDDAVEAVLHAISDRAPLVRCAAAVAATRLPPGADRAEALAKIDGRLKAGAESDAGTKEVMDLARSVLSGQRVEVVWPEPGPDPFFRETALSYEERLLRAINRRAESSLDLDKVQLLTSDFGAAASPGARVLDNPYSQGGDLGDGVRTDEIPAGHNRTGSPQALRDLKIELRRRPYFTAADLPGAPTAVTK